jgi:hypothetical protein
VVKGIGRVPDHVKGRLPFDADVYLRCVTQTEAQFALTVETGMFAILVETTRIHTPTSWLPSTEDDTLSQQTTENTNETIPQVEKIMVIQTTIKPLHTRLSY